MALTTPASRALAQDTAASSAPSQGAPSQGALTGRIVAAEGRQPLPNITIAIPALGLTTSSDSAGRYRLAPVGPGEYFVITRAPGFHPDTSVVAIATDAGAARDIVLTRTAVPLGEVRVSAPQPVPPKMRAFEERRSLGVGRFIDRATIEKYSQSQTAEIIQQVPGVSIVRGIGNKAWASSGRTMQTGCAFCRSGGFDPADIGAKPACYFDVYLDGALVYSSAQRNGAPLFNLNSIQPSQIEGVEVFQGAQVPAQYNRTGGGCGVMLIWTRA